MDHNERIETAAVHLEPSFVDIPTTGVILGNIGRSLVFDLIATGELVSVKLRGRRLFAVQSIREFAARLQAAS